MTTMCLRSIELVYMMDLATFDCDRTNNKIPQVEKAIRKLAAVAPTDCPAPFICGTAAMPEGLAICSHAVESLQKTPGRTNGSRPS